MTTLFCWYDLLIHFYSVTCLLCKCRASNQSMGSKAVEDLIQASSGVHFSGFHLEEPRTSEIEQPTTSIDESVKQPFVIGMSRQ